MESGSCATGRVYKALVSVADSYNIQEPRVVTRRELGCQEGRESGLSRYVPLRAHKIIPQLQHSLSCAVPCTTASMALSLYII